MIHTSRTVTVGKTESIINEPIVLYRGDREVEVEFAIVGSKFTFTNGGNVIQSTNATHGQLVVDTPTGENMFSEVTECHEGKVIFTITKEMIDELAEVGLYSFQIRLFDESQVSRVTIPPVYQGIEIRHPMAAEDETDLVDIGLVDYSVVRKNDYENVATFLPNGDYNKTNWEKHDVISKDRLNKVEDALYEINKSTEGLYPTLQNQYDEFSAKVNKDVKAYKEEMEDEVDQFERDMTQAFGEFKVDYKDEVHDRLDVVEGELDSVNSQLAHITYIANGDNIAKEINTLIEKGYKKIKIPSGSFEVKETIKLASNVELYGNKDSILWTDEDISVISTLYNDEVTYDNIYMHDIQITSKKADITYNWTIDLKNANMLRMERVICDCKQSDINSNSGMKIWKTSRVTAWSPLLNKIDFRSASIKINITDGYITDSNIWGNGRKYALWIAASSQHISDVQLVGGDELGGIYVYREDGGELELIKINNVYFDGSHSNIQSGVGLNAHKMVRSSLTNSSIWWQKKDGIVLNDCHSNVISNCIFEQNGYNNKEQSSLNNNNKFADIRIKGLTYGNIFSNLTFTMLNDFYIKNYIIFSENTTTYQYQYNVLDNLYCPTNSKYANIPYVIDFEYAGNNIRLTQANQNKLIGSVEIDSSITAKSLKTTNITSDSMNISNGHKVMIVFSGMPTSGKTISLKPNGQNLSRLRVYNEGFILGGAVTFQSQLEGTITFNIYRNNGAELIGSLICNNGYGSILKFNYGEKKIYEGDLIVISAVSGDNSTDPGEVSFSLVFTQ